MHAGHPADPVRHLQDQPSPNKGTVRIGLVCKHPVIATMYTGRYQVLRHRCERSTSVTGVFSTVTMNWVG